MRFTSLFPSLFPRHTFICMFICIHLIYYVFLHGASRPSGYGFPQIYISLFSVSLPITVHNPAYLARKIGLYCINHIKSSKLYLMLLFAHARIS